MANETIEAAAVEQAVHPMKKSYTFVSTKHVDVDDLTYFEAASMTFALVLAVTIGVLNSAVLG
jgi:hypothetical protein